MYRNELKWDGGGAGSKRVHVMRDVWESMQAASSGLAKQDYTIIQARL